MFIRRVLHTHHYLVQSFQEPSNIGQYSYPPLQLVLLQLGVCGLSNATKGVHGRGKIQTIFWIGQLNLL